MSGSISTENLNVHQEWANLYHYLWNEFEKKWPMFSLTGFKIFKYDLFFENGKFLSPYEIKKEILIPFIKVHMEKHRLDVGSLLNKEKREDIVWIYDFAHSITLTWNLKFDEVEVTLIQNPFYGNGGSFKFLKERFGFEDKTIELTSYFSEKINITKSQKFNELIQKEFLSFKDRWQDELNNEVRKAKKILEKIIDDMFVQNGNLKKQAYSSK